MPIYTYDIYVNWWDKLKRILAFMTCKKITQCESTQANFYLNHLKLYFVYRYIGHLLHQNRVCILFHFNENVTLCNILCQLWYGLVCQHVKRLSRLWNDQTLLRKRLELSIEQWYQRNKKVHKQIWDLKQLS